MTPEQKPELNEEEKRLAELERAAKAARLGGGVCSPFEDDKDKEDPDIDKIAAAARNVY